MNRGGQNVNFAEKVGAVGATTTSVYIDRAAILNKRFDRIQERRVRGVVIVMRDGFADQSELVLNKREHVAELRDALTAALDAEETWGWQAP